jgi:endonuclease-3
VSRRLGLTKHDDPEKVEQDLMKLVPRDDWALFSHLLIFHGRRICVARKPKCAECALATMCPSAFRVG